MNARDLRNSILQYAIQGNLVYQDSGERPVSELLDQISTNKTTSGKKVNKDNLPLSSNEKNIPFAIPESWTWQRLSDIASITLGKTPAKGNETFWSSKADSYNWVTIADMINDKVIESTKMRITEKAVSEVFSKKFVDEGTLIMSFKLTIGKTSIMGFNGFHNEAIASIVPYYDENNILRNFLLKVLPLISQSGEFKGAIKGKTLNKTTLSKLLIPLPPLEEQKRIVGKIEELFEKVDQYDLLEGKLSSLNESFPIKMEKSILQYALEGKLLTPKIPYEIVNHEINENNILNIPKHWDVMKLEDVASVVRGGSPRPISNYITNEENGINWIKIGDTTIGGKYIEHTRQKIKSSGLNKTRLIHEGDFLLSNSMSYGRPYISKITGAIHDGWLAISDYDDKLDRDFLYYLLSSEIAFKQFQSLVSGTTVKNLTRDKVKSVYLPIPSLEEQKLIVNRIDEIKNSLVRIKSILT